MGKSTISMAIFWFFFNSKLFVYQRVTNPGSSGFILPKPCTTSAAIRRWDGNSKLRRCDWFSRGALVRWVIFPDVLPKWSNLWGKKEIVCLNWVRFCWIEKLQLDSVGFYTFSSLRVSEQADKMVSLCTDLLIDFQKSMKMQLELPEIQGFTKFCQVFFISCGPWFWHWSKRSK